MADDPAAVPPAYAALGPHGPALYTTGYQIFLTKSGGKLTPAQCRELLLDLLPLYRETIPHPPPPYRPHLPPR